MMHRGAGITRRQWIAFTSLAMIAPRARSAAPAAASWTVRRLPSSAPLRQIRPGEARTLLAAGADGTLWSYPPHDVPRLLATDLDFTTPVGTGYGLIAARTRDGGLLVNADGRNRIAGSVGLAPGAGLLMLPFAVVGIVADGPHGRVVRFEPGAKGWTESDRSDESVVPDARPILAALDRGTGEGEPGEVVVLGGPDATRYDHGVLGDRIEATRMLWLDRHTLRTLRELTLPAPYVFEDIAPRAVTTAQGVALLTMRSGGSGTRLALVAADPADAKRLRLAAIGDPIGGPHRWLAPTTDGRHLMGVHTPHVGGVLHAYDLDGDRLAATPIAGGVANHRIGTRELDLAVWSGTTLIVPSQDGRRLRVFDAAQRWSEQPSIDLPSPVVMTADRGTRIPHGSPGSRRAFAALLDDGSAYRIEEVR